MESLDRKIPGYDYGNPALTPSIVSMSELALLKISAQFSDEDTRYLLLAGNVLQPHVKQIVSRWRTDIIASIPHLARHSRDPQGCPLPPYLAASSLRFEQWILDVCRRPYDQQWLDYQQEIALRHTIAKKNVTDGVLSTDHVPLRDIIAFVAVMNRSIRCFLAAQGHSESVVEAMHAAWQKSLQIQIAIWTKVYMSMEGHFQSW